MSGAENPLSASSKAEAGPSAPALLWQRQAAENALRAGFASEAVSSLRRLLETWPEEKPGGEEVAFSLASALLADRRWTEAAELIQSRGDETSPRWRLRAALVDWNLRRWDDLENRLGEWEEDSLPVEEQAWVVFLQAVLRERAGDAAGAEELYQKAMETASTEGLRTAFAVSRHRQLLLTEEPDENVAEELRSQMEAFQGRSAGHRFAQQYAVVLDALGKKQGAAEVLTRQIQTISTAERDLRDQFLLLHGLIAGPQSGPGRQSLRELLETGGRREMQRLALQQLNLGQSSDSGPHWDLINRLIEAGHPLLEELLLARSRISLRAALEGPADDRPARFQSAASDADELLTRFPGSRLAVDALEILSLGAWEQRQYRTAANYLNRLRTALPEGSRRAEIGLLVADSYFRAGEVNRTSEDYRNAADAYGTVLRAPPPTVPVGLVLFQRVLAEIRGGRLAEAGNHLREAEGSSGLDPVHRWQAEWNLVKALQQAGRMREAYERSQIFFPEARNGLPPGDLTLRLKWLQAQLAFDVGRHEEALPLVLKVLEEAGGEPPPLAGEELHRVISHALLLQGRILLALGQPDEALPVMERIRRDFAETGPAMFSYLVEARYYTGVNRTVDAQQMLITLADNHPGSPYAPIALFEAALNAQRRGQDPSYQEQAISLLERLVREHPGHELAFHARLRQGDLLRQMAKFADAEAVYLSLENSLPHHPDLPLVRLSLADSLLAQAARGDDGRWEQAVAVLERLFDLPSISADFRAEAGYKLAFAQARRGQTARAKEGFWANVSTLLLENPEQLPGPRGRYWVSRSLFEYARLLEESGQAERARKAYALIRESNLPGQSLAEAGLARLSPQTAAP